jgi:hypothetical protein
VDAVFSTSVVPAVAATTPLPGATGVSTTAPDITATFNEPVQSGTIAFVLVDSSGNSVPAAVSYNAATNTAILTPTGALADSTTDTATISGAQDAAGNEMTSPVSWSFTTAPAASTPVTIWSSTAAPATPSVGDTRSVELGVKFDSDVAGYITGIRFYKGSGNVGTHVGYLWSSDGTLLASATFTNETDTGWQQVNFSTPVAITAGTTYIASYLAPNGHYSYDEGYFTYSGVDNGALHALSNGAAGGNGVFVYGSGGFPSQTCAATNYWVDVVFSNTV